MASDGVNADVEQSLTLAINDLDEVAPQLTSTDSIIVTEGTVGELYTATADDIVIMNCTSNHQIEIHTFNVSSSGWDFILVNRSGSELATATAIAFNFIVMQ